MSQDLFASFLESDAASTGSKPQATTSIAGGSTSNGWENLGASIWDATPQASGPSVAEDDDDFGDFEDARVEDLGDRTQHQFDPRSTASKHTPPVAHKHDSFPPKAPRKTTSTTDPLPAKGVESKQEKAGQHPFSGHMDLLFGADDDDEYDAGVDELGDLSTNPEAAMAYSKRIIAEQEAALDKSRNQTGPKYVPGGSGPQSYHTRPAGSQEKTLAPAPRKDPNVLFDADDVSEHDDDDEFGGFESGNEDLGNSQDAKQPATTPQAKTQSTTLAIDLLRLDDDPLPPQAGKKSDPKPLSKQAAPQSRIPKTVPVRSTKQTNTDVHDAWDDFETTPATSSSKTPRVETTSSRPPQTQSKPIKPSTPKDNAQPPVNIPPPAVLISLFPSIIAEADDALFNAMNRLDLKQRQMLLGHPASHHFLKGYLAHCRTMAHIIAGRKSRWKRDQHLAQSIRIGPASAGGKPGMKLAGLDKAETAKEDREVVDVLRLWHNQVGKLRTAATAASAAPSLSKLPAVPELAEQMPVRAVKIAEGGITAPHACALCGLKREERVAKVDVEIDDSFGEWWVESMSMHVSCRDFWHEFQKKLKSR